MDSIERWKENVFYEHLWRSHTYEVVYLNAYELVNSTIQGIDNWQINYNTKSRHIALGRKTLDQPYFNLPSGLSQVA